MGQGWLNLRSNDPITPPTDRCAIASPTGEGLEGQLAIESMNFAISTSSALTPSASWVVSTTSTRL